MTTVVCVHGIGGTAATMQPLADLLSASGLDAIAITLPGHGTVPEDLLDVTWQDWLQAIPEADVIVGQSMGGALAFAAAATRAGTCGVVAINAPVGDPDALDGLEWRMSRGHVWVDEVTAAPGEVTYERLPLSALATMVGGALQTDLQAVLQPVLLITSADDDVVDPANSEIIADGLGGDVSRLVLSDAGHVASLSAAIDTIADAIVHFVRALPGQLAPPL